MADLVTIDYTMIIIFGAVVGAHLVLIGIMLAVTAPRKSARKADDDELPAV